MPEGPEFSAPVDPSPEEAVPVTAAPAVATPAVVGPATPVTTAPSRSAEQTARAVRLAGALRDNLRRRKAPKRPPASSGN